MVILIKMLKRGGRLMSLRRVVAKVKIAKRNIDKRKEQETIRQLGLARNKALREAARATEIAMAQEKLRQAQLKKVKAEAPIKAAKAKEAARRKKKAQETVKKINKTVK